MASALLPGNEAQRQAALDSYEVLDAKSTEAMDAVVLLASRICEVPIALVSLVDRGRIWFLAGVGLTGLEEVPREAGFCPHAIPEPGLLLVEDATKDPRFLDNPFVAGIPGVRFYAGMPLVDGEGFALGTLCVSDFVPRALSDSQKESLRDLSLVVVSLLQARRMALTAKRAARDLELVLDAVPAMVGGADREGRTRFANRSLAAHFGRTPAEMIGLTLGEVGDEAAYERNRRAVEGALRGEVQTYEQELTRPTGERQDLKTTFVPDWADGVVRGFVATSTDVTELKEAVRRSERRNELLQLAADIADIGHWRLQYGTDQIDWSPHVYRIHGLDPATYHPTQSQSFEHIHPDDRTLVADAFRAAGQQQEPFEVQCRLLRSDGSTRRISLKGRNELDAVTGASRGLFGVVQDITEREGLRERAERQERLVTTGTLAAGVGHEINNPLTYIMANIDFAIDELRASDNGASSARLREVIDVLIEARGGSERIKTIVRALHAFAREEATPVPTNVRATMENALNAGMHELRHRATLVTDDGDVRPVLADESRLSQLLLNLLVNAAQSFSSADMAKNRILVTTRNAPGQRVLIEISDNGCGMAPAVMARAFDPFFTTKPVGQATGLGLSICHNIVTALGGEISCTSGLGVGTTFRVSLPAAPEVELAPRAEGTAAAALRGRILIVDDDPLVLRSLTRLLSGEHEVVSLSDPREARRRLVDESEEFDVVFCNVTMPYLSGMELYRLVLAYSALLAERFVFISGGGIREEERAFLADIPNERLEKPFSNQNLRGMARRFVGSVRRGEPA